LVREFDHTIERKGFIMTSHPVQFSVEPRGRIARIQVAIRLVLLLAVGAIGCASVYWVLYLALPALVAAVVLRKGGSAYLAEDGPRIVKVLRWLGGGYAYLWLLTDVLPTTIPGAFLRLDVSLEATPTASSSLLRLLYSAPALLLATVMSLASHLTRLRRSRGGAAPPRGPLPTDPSRPVRRSRTSRCLEKLPRSPSGKTCLIRSHFDRVRHLEKMQLRL
jgi:hypothetical protein